MWARLRLGSPSAVRVIVGGTILAGSGADGGFLSWSAPARRQAAQDVPPGETRTRFSLVAGDPAVHLEDHFAVAKDSPMVTAFPFLEWRFQDGPPATASAPRSGVACTLLQATRRPTLLDHSRLETLSFLSHEVLSTEASRWAKALDSVKAFDAVYPHFGSWASKASTFSAQAADPTLLQLREDSFTETEEWDSESGPTDLAFLAHTTIADLITADDHLPDANFQPRTLARAMLMMGSKDNATERDDESSSVRLAAESITGALQQDMRVSVPSAAGMARRFVSMLRTVELPATFCMQAIKSSSALREFEHGYAYAHSNAAEAATIEAELFLNVGRAHPSLHPVLERFPSGPSAVVEFHRLALQLLPAALSSATNLVRIPALADLMGQASWRATVSHLINADANILGPKLVSDLIRSHTEVTASSSGSGGSGGDLGDLTFNSAASYGSIRDQSIGDALRSKDASEALEAAKDLTGVKRVEEIMQSGAVLLTRAELLQESWLHNKHAVLASCSLDAPYLCPYFASVLTEDKVSGEVPARLQPYVFPSSELGVIRSKAWSDMDLLGEALKIRHLQRGTVTKMPNKKELYVVEKCLNLLKDHGARLFFGLNLGLSPTEGYSFTDGVDLQLEAVDFALTLPEAESSEWLTFLDKEFRTNWLDAGGEHYHAKLKTGRPDATEAQLSEFLPLGNAYFKNVRSRMTRAEPVAEFRVAFPTMFASKPVSIAGTSAAHSSNGGGGGGGNSGGGGGGGASSSGRPDNGKQNQKRLFEQGASGPGSKSKLALPLAKDELWFGGVVFQLDKIAEHYKCKAEKDKLCWPVLLTKKKGAAALEVCPHHATHGDLKQDPHKRPANFNLEHIYKQFTRAASNAENKSAGWKPMKKKKA